MKRIYSVLLLETKTQSDYHNTTKIGTEQKSAVYPDRLATRLVFHIFSSTSQRIGPLSYSWKRITCQCHDISNWINTPDYASLNKPVKSRCNEHQSRKVYPYSNKYEYIPNAPSRVIHTQLPWYSFMLNVSLVSQRKLHPVRRKKCMNKVHLWSQCIIKINLKAKSRISF